MKQYLDFLNNASQILAPFDDTAKCLLEEIALSFHEGRTVSVTDLMNMVHVASPATVHRKMTDLLTLGYITQVYKFPDRRTKYVKLTPKGGMYFMAMQSAMEKAMK